MTTFPPPNLLHLDAVNLGLTAATGPEVVRELHAPLAQLDAVRDPGALLQDLLARQALGCNCLDAQIAMPHARTAAVDRFVLAVGRSARGIAFDGQHSAVRLVILIGVPFDAVTEYLRWMAHLARALRNPPLRQALLTAPTAADFESVWSLSIMSPNS